MLLGAGLSLVTIVSSYLGLAAVFGRSKQLVSIIVLGGFVVRVGMLFALLASIARNFDVALEQVVIWTVSFYFVLILFEARELDARSRKRTPEA